MKVAYFTETLPPKTDGVVKTLVRLADHLVEEKVDFEFFSPVKPEENQVGWADRVTKVSSVPLWLYKDYNFTFPYFDGIQRRLDKMKPDLLHICAPSLLGLFGLHYGEKHDIPVVTSYHTHWVSYFSYFGISQYEKVGWKYLQWFHNKCEKTYAPSTSAISELETKGIDTERLELWQRGIELDLFSPKHRDNELRRSIGAENDPVFLFVGRLINHKDLDDLIEANRILQQKGHKFKQVIVGDGPMHDQVRKQLPDAIMPGYQYGADLSRWYATADVFSFPSTTETFGNVILESFASGIPAVGVAQGGVADIINHEKDGLIAQPKNAVDFAANLERLIVDVDFRNKLGQQAIKTASEYSWNAINGRLLQSYNDVVVNHQKVHFDNALRN